MDNKSVGRRPGYIAFRIEAGGRFFAVIARLRCGGKSEPPWAFWHSKLAPWGELKRVPADYMHLQVDEFTATRMIEIIASGESLPEEFIKGLPRSAMLESRLKAR